MRDVRRIRLHGIRLLFLFVIAALAGCSEKHSVEENGSIQMNESTVHDFGKRKDEVLMEETEPDKSAKSCISEDEMTPMGWYAPNLEDLRGTTWSTYQDSDEGERTIYDLELYGGEQADYGEYDGEACFSWQYGDEEECQEYYEGWWSLEEVDGQVCLRLDICRIGGIMYREGEEPKVISNQFPVYCDMEGMSMILHKGMQNGASLPFLNEQTDFEFLTQPVG